MRTLARQHPGVAALFLAFLSLATALPATAAEQRIKGPEIKSHPIAPIALQYVELVHAGKMEDAVKLAYDKAQAEWKKYPGERASYASFMKKMMPTRADLEASLAGSAILVIDGNKASLSVIRMEQESTGPGAIKGASTTVAIPFVLEGGTWKVGA